MSNQFYNEYPKFLVSVDCIIFGFKEGTLKLLVQKRPYNPGKGEMSLIGGFVEEGESIDETAQRILTKFTGIGKVYMQQLGAFGEVERDPGERVITIGYYALINSADFDESLTRENEAQWVDIDNVPKLFSDHNKMVEKARRNLQKKVNSNPICVNLLPKYFTLTQLQTLQESILGVELDKRNFRRSVAFKDYIVKTKYIDKENSKRGARLYKFQLEDI
ncbi:MAG: NUDIX domain-containing protein [Bacteroidaceae bacterium]|nr:NUDIX domain-containing protein [Bacteroidaceae bacterium]